jgi:hypothetical protein
MKGTMRRRGAMTGRGREEGGGGGGAPGVAVETSVVKFIGDLEDALLLVDLAGEGPRPQRIDRMLRHGDPHQHEGPRVIQSSHIARSIGRGDDGVRAEGHEEEPLGHAFLSLDHVQHLQGESKGGVGKRERDLEHGQHLHGAVQISPRVGPLET